MSALCHNRTHAPQQGSPTHFVGAGKHRGGNGEPERLRGGEIDAELETGRLLDRHVRWTFVFHDRDFA